jgi:hypothetical protein
MPVSVELNILRVERGAMYCACTPGSPHSAELCISISNSVGIVTLEPMCLDALSKRGHMVVLDTPVLGPGKLGSAKRIKRISRKQEQRTAESSGGRAQSGSGSRPGYKGDVRVYDKYRIENKFTFAGSYKIDMLTLNKIRGECEGNERPAVSLDFVDKLTGRTRDTWVIIPKADWEKLNAATDES